MIRKMFKKAAGIALAVTLSLSLAAGGALLATPVVVSAAQPVISSDELSNMGWSRISPRSNQWERNSSYYTVDSVDEIRVPLPDFMVANRPEDGFRVDLSSSAKDFINDARVELVSGDVIINPNRYYSDYAGQTGDISVARGGITVTDKDYDDAEGYFYYNVRLRVPKSTDNYSEREGWKTRDSGSSYTQTLDTQKIGEGSQGRTIYVSLPRLSPNETFDNKSILDDSSMWKMIRNIYVDSSRSRMEITFVDNLTPQVGKSSTIVLRKSIYNDSNVYATYTLNVPVKIANLSEAKVNGYTGPATIRVSKGDKDAVRVTNVSNLYNAKVHWTTDASGYVDVSNQNSYPQVSSDGYINTSGMAAGVYYFYLRVNNDMETRTFTLVIDEKATPVPTPTPSQNTIYRLLDTRTGEHLYTTDTNEVKVLNQRGWNIETSPGVSGGSVPIYRLFDTKTGEHLYSSDTNECRVLASRGWIYDNNAKPIFYGSNNGTKPMFRLYNSKNARIASHHYTSDINECRVLVTQGSWVYDNGGKPVYYLQ